MDIVYHYPPELLQLLIDVIPRLVRSKNDVIIFFRGAGVPSDCYADLEQRVRTDRENLNKFEIARTVLTRLNERGESALRERREVLKRVVEFEDFSTAWPNDQLRAKGLVAEIRRVINVKDAFTRMHQEREHERQQHSRQHQNRLAAIEARKRAIDEVRKDFYALFAMEEPRRRGTMCESVFNRLFQVESILIRESFRITDDKSPGVMEQIDGVIELANHIYFVEMKWLSRPVDIDDVSRHLVRIYHRGYSRGLFISATEFTSAALSTCVEALQRTVISLVTFDELTRLLESHGDLPAFLLEKINIAIVDKQPYRKLLV
jgi:restriction system protein